MVALQKKLVRLLVSSFERIDKSKLNQFLGPFMICRPWAPRPPPQSSATLMGRSGVQSSRYWPRKRSVPAVLSSVFELQCRWTGPNPVVFLTEQTPIWLAVPRVGIVAPLRYVRRMGKEIWYRVGVIAIAMLPVLLLVLALFYN